MFTNALYSILLSLFLLPCTLSAIEEKCSESNSAYSDEFIAGYLQSKLEDRFPDAEIRLAVCKGEIIVYQYPHDTYICENILYYLQSLNDNAVVKFERDFDPNLLENNLSIQVTVPQEGNWLPELAPFFPTILANPRMICYSAGYRFYDKIFETELLPVSMGDRFLIYQFKNIGEGRLYLGVEAAVWAIFEAKVKSLALINADYYVGFPITYINNRFSARLRVYHQSSHLGDELLVENTSIERLNPSMEVIDLFLAYDLTNDLTVLGGVGRVLRSDESYKIKPYSIEYGCNYLFNSFKINLANLIATPYLGLYFRNWEDNRWKLDSSIAIGYQWNKSYGRKMRFFIEAHDGFSFEGQFSKLRTRYLAIKLSYGY